ncbi:hypothetical protein CCR75_009604 [Bremia lactucae]|uniref:Uncharacterized protein n=1 Tax=Bremia lactucae TaxID=4779 RepID=A0A976FFP2_BRELC|nr:hypothetical protein CCR75_009604 [Bremia lactucae]
MFFGQSYCMLIHWIVPSSGSVDMPPMEVTLKTGATPVKCRSRRYSPTHQAHWFFDRRRTLLSKPKKPAYRPTS